MDTLQLVCPKCNNPVAPTDLFCPHCGVKLGPETISLGRQIYIYTISLLAPPFGLIWTFKYLMDPKKRFVGIIAGIITIISLILTIQLTMGFFQGVQSQLNSVQNVGY